jgi:hypothetical protein
MNPVMDADSIEMWEAHDELRCVIRPRGECWELSLMRRRCNVKVDVFTDAAAALAAADEWRRSIELSDDRPAE